MIKILFIGDIVGKPGRDLIKIYLPGFVKRHSIDLVIANVENSAGGKGVTRNVADTLLDAGVDVMTSGNHIWDKKEALEYIALEPRLLRPANYPSDTQGFLCFTKKRIRTCGGDKYYGPHLHEST